MSKSALVGSFWLTSSIDDGSGSVTTLSPGGAAADHVIEVENGTMLPHDVKVSSSIPSRVPKLDFATSSGHRPDWEAELHSIASNTTAQDRCPVTLLANSGQERLQSVTLQYRLNATCAWAADTSNLPLQLDIDIR